MVAFPALWLPILISGVLVFAASSFIHMFLPYHRTDYGKVPDEDGVMDAMRGFDIPPGDYVVPCAGSPETLKSEEFRAKAVKGPVWFMTMLPAGDPFRMGGQLIQWFLYCVFVSACTAYLAVLALEVGASYMAVFRFVGTAAFFGYALAHIPRSIWYRQKWSTTAKNVLDGFIFGLLTGGVFGWLWPV